MTWKDARNITAGHDAQVAELERQARRDLCRKLNIPYEPPRERRSDTLPREPRPGNFLPWFLALCYVAICVGAGWAILSP